MRIGHGDVETPGREDVGLGISPSRPTPGAVASGQHEAVGHETPPYEVGDARTSQRRAGSRGENSTHHSSLVTRALSLLLILVLAVLLTSCRASAGPDLKKNDLGRKPTPDFTLTDQDGETVRMSGLQGRAVVLTFLYTSCPDVCPVITSTFAETYDRLGEDGGKVRFAVVTVDPERDTVERVRQYLEAQGYEDKMVFLTGDRPSLERTWLDYYIGVVKGPAKEGEFYTVDHQNAVYLIDAEGRQRTLIRGWDFTADQLLGELRPLLDEID